MPDKTKLHPDVLSAALEGLASQRRRIEDQIAAVRRMLGKVVGPVGDSVQPPPRKGRMSAAARKRIAAAQRQRWDAYHKAHTSPPAKAAAKTKAAPKRTLSAAGRKHIADAARKRWAAFRKAKRAKKSAAKPAQAAAAEATAS